MNGDVVAIDQEKIETFHQQFMELDIQADGKLTRNIVAQILAKESEQLEQIMVTLLFEKYDQNHDGFIQWEEFRKFCMDMDSLSEKDILQQIFDLCDLDHNGYLDVAEVNRLGKLMGLPVTYNDAKATIQALDANNDNKVSFEEFCQIYEQSL